ncbi:hypothetical protein E4T81_05260 [Barnesiella sp. WM24]|uniref:hypothetical protein n=1 Tax=Barnesiella sp. WM24 TaxID=2558278 RepID=UPI0010723DF5|nr:hypothetical protein [Barnesiella sp. WM24]TFU94002.1 hypothetical protein E4T81_05260 [Barnesiella sp. WM24]
MRQEQDGFFVPLLAVFSVLCPILGIIGFVMILADVTDIIDLKKFDVKILFSAMFILGLAALWWLLLRKKRYYCYTAKEAFTFPLLCLVCLAFNIYCVCSDVWPVGAIVGTSFFGIFTLVYVFKYSRFGRDYLRIDANGISVRLSGMYCRNKNVINAIEQFGGSEVYDSQSSHAQNMYLGRIILFAIGLFVLFALLSCNNRHDLTENYSVFTYGEGLYGESEEDYPVFVSKLGYKDAPPFIANVRQVWWNDSTIIIEQNNDYWWIVTAVDNRLSYGDKYVGPLSAREKDSIMVAEKIRTEQMKHRCYE